MKRARHYERIVLATPARLDCRGQDYDCSRGDRLRDIGAVTPSSARGVRIRAGPRST
jgi:hypothetical protein